MAEEFVRAGVTGKPRDDRRARIGYAGAMFRRGWVLLVCLLASSLIATTTVHAREGIPGVELSCSGVTHLSGEAEEPAGTADSGQPHHHGACHGHGFATSVSSAAVAVMAPRSQDPVASLFARLAPHTLDTALRPPRA
jgi:hypothetical protein